MLRGETLRAALDAVSRRPFCLVPFFDPGPWGGQWMRRHFDLPDGPANYAWCFNCVPEENSLVLRFGTRMFELPALTLVHECADTLLGGQIVREFGAEFPIRFDFLDTMEGGNLSLQVHPLRSYIRKEFGLSYTQDESYYMLDAAQDATVLLGLREGIEQRAMAAGTSRRAGGRRPFPRRSVCEYMASTQARPFSHSGRDHSLLRAEWHGPRDQRNALHLHFQAVGLGPARAGWTATSDPSGTWLEEHPVEPHNEWVREHLIDQKELMASGEGWREERTGLHALEFLETRRHWFTAAVHHDTQGNLNVLNLVEGDAAIVESPTDAFPPLTVHYAETFIVPAAVGPYTIRPVSAVEKPLATIKAYVREGA